MDKQLAYQLIAADFLSVHKFPLRLSISMSGKYKSCIIFKVCSEPWEENIHIFNTEICYNNSLPSLILEAQQ
jgi:hypothetical protein